MNVWIGRRIHSCVSDRCLHEMMDRLLWHANGPPPEAHLAWPPHLVQVHHWDSNGTI